MKIAPILYAAIMGLQEAMKNMLTGTQIEHVTEKINRFAIASAVATGVACMAPGTGSVIAVFAQTGMVWSMYLQINKTLGISVKENTLKFLGSAILTNLLNNFGAYILSYTLAGIVSFFVGIGTAVAFLIGAGVGFVCMYTSAIIYLKLLTRFVNDKGDLNFADEDVIRMAVENVMKGMDIKAAIGEAKEAFLEARKNGELRKARKDPRCPSCGCPVTPGQKFCSECGTPIR